VLFVIEGVAVGVAGVGGAPPHVALRKMRGSVAWLHGIAPQQPIGD
jgi:RpiR family transcriptional regulator, carbohydrate utilization regulator